MQRNEQEQYYALGADYWWLVGKYRVVIDLITRHLRPGPKIRMLDLGCGPGNTLDWLRAYGEGIGLDASPDAIAFCRERGYPNSLVADACAIPFDDNVFDLVVAMDVVEHIADDATVVREVLRTLKPGGVFLMTVPTFMVLWGDHDNIYFHKRRYRLPQIRHLVTDAGFEISKLSYFQPIYFLPMLLYRKVKRVLGSRFQRDDFVSLPRWLNRLLGDLVAAERFWLRRFNFPIGVTSICIARKPVSPQITKQRECKNTRETASTKADGLAHMMPPRDERYGDACPIGSAPLQPS